MKRWYLVRMRGERTQQEVAAEAGMSQQYYGMIENGGRQKDMGMDVVERLARAFGVEVEEMVRGERQHRERSGAVRLARRKESGRCRG